ncbi:MAG: enoyl-CoA hydratase/isomerase family protein [Parvularculaceae bacterium]|nr:enoyl-CoA hydratase/isomerase family protein [Parvularculaceae bacterium]
MAHPFSRKELYRTHLEEYSEKWKEYFHFKRSDGILEVRMHSDGGPCRWDIEIHRALIPAFADIHFDPENECVILTGTGDTFLAEFDDESWGRLGYRDKFTFGHSYDHFYFDQTKEPFALLNLEIPVIAAINGPLFIHAELALLNDIVLCSENTTMKDAHFSGVGIVPGDGVHTLFRELLGHVRGKHFLYTGQELDAAELLRLGLVSEVLPQDELLDRAWDIARTLFMTKDRIQRRITRSLFIQPWRELFTKELAFGQGLESWACHSYWPMTDPKYDVSRLEAGEKKED